MLATGRQITRSVGYAVVHGGEHVTIDEVVFAEPGDLSCSVRGRSKGST